MKKYKLAYLFEDLMNIYALMEDVHKLKHLPRTGWVKNQISNPETVASHVLGVTILAATIQHPKEINKNELINLALFHDLAEAKIGDIISSKGNKTDEKKNKNKEDLEKKYFKTKPKQIKNAGLKFIKKDTPEALYLRDLDKLDMAFQAYFYEEETGKDLSEFFINATTNMTFENIKKILIELKTKRKIST